jgi:hypothetical protein
MKTTRWVFVVALATLLAAGVVQAQVQFVFVEKMVEYNQNSENAPSVASGNPYLFRFAVNGAGSSSLSGYTPIRVVTTASGSGVSGPLNATNYDPGDDSWEMTPLVYADLASLNGAFADGVYGLNVNGTTFNVTLGSGSGPYANGFPAAAPMLTGLTAGDFDGSGRLKIDLALSTYTFNLNGLAGYSSGGHVGVFIDGVTVSGNPVQGESIKFGSFNDPELTFLTFNPSASNMIAGNTYTIELEYNLAPNATSNLLGSGDLDLGLFTYRTQLTLIAVPEPATFAEILGLVALTGVMLHRRRRAA